MTLQTRLFVYLLALHLPLYGCAALLLPQQPLLFVGAELALLATLALGWRLVRQALEPLGYTRRLRDLLQDQQYASRLAMLDSAGSRELHELVDAFNAMLAALHRERLAAGEQQGFLDRLLAATPAAVLVFDFDHAISLMNPSAGALLGFEQPLGRPLSYWIDSDADDAEKFAPALDARARTRARELAAQLAAQPPGESRLMTDLDGRRYRAQRGQFYDRGFARHFLMVEELTAELEDSERATYARLIRVLAHEVNNTVAATGSVLESLLTYRSQLNESDAGDFATAIVAVKRRNASLGQFIGRFTEVVKMPAPALRPASLGDVVDDILWLHRDACKARAIALGWARRDAVPPLMLDVQLIEGALLNIVKNAIEAVDESRDRDRDGRGGSGGAIRIKLAREARHVRLSVIDSGGLLEQTPLRQLFTPFFSTKKGGQGISLVFVREVLTRHGCRYALAPGVPGETRFDVWFPVSSQATGSSFP
ncbi:PAS domain-containing sensor histidine kinase [Massilia sp. 9096]|uniref:sensor histidine kinase n=1 Tax=Massilia sp. 9096 TaxID=1500894 RepID=UPI00056A414B|nr:ATP-binding protein [Massilia sp. 9096]